MSRFKHCPLCGIVLDRKNTVRLKSAHENLGEHQTKYNTKIIKERAALIKICKACYKFETGYDHDEIFANHMHDSKAIIGLFREKTSRRNGRFFSSGYSSKLDI